MARWKATGEYIPNLTSKQLSCIWIIRKSGGGGGVTSPAIWEVHLHEERALCDIERFVARTETSNGALER